MYIILYSIDGLFLTDLVRLSKFLLPKKLFAKQMLLKY